MVKEAISSYQDQLSNDYGINKKTQNKCFKAFNDIAKDNIKKSWIKTEVWQAARNDENKETNEDQWLDRFCENLKDSLKGKI